MREIKFRAWDELNKVMHNEFEFIKSGNDNTDWIVFKSDKQKLEDGNVFSNPYFAQQLKVMQYTGLKDANRKEIYEGDIVEWVEAKPKNYQIEFIEGAFCLNNKSQSQEGCPIDINTVYLNIGRGIKVIGNIYKNPEMEV